MHHGADHWSRSFRQATDGAFRRRTTRPTAALLRARPKRLRVLAGGQTIVDSRRVIALHETGQMMRLCAPWPDGRREVLVEGSMAYSGRAGSLRSWSAVGGGRVVAQSFEAPPTAAAAALKDHVVLDLEKVDAWYLKDDLGDAHPRAP